MRRLVKSGGEPGLLAYDGGRAIGWVAVAPREVDFVDSVPPSYFGGNLDNWRLGKGATVYLPVSVPGALGYMAAGWDRIGLPPFSVGFVWVAAVVALMPASFLTAKLGATVAHRVAKHRLEVCFALYLVLVSAHFAVTLALA